MTGDRWDRPEPLRALDQLRDGDVFVVWKPDRLSRSLKDLLHLMVQIPHEGAGFRALTESIDTTTPAGRMMMQLVETFAEFEREMIRERTKAGLESARAGGHIGGRPRKLKAKRRAELAGGVQGERHTRAVAARLWNVHPAHVTRRLAEAREKD